MSDDRPANAKPLVAGLAGIVAPANAALAKIHYRGCSVRETAGAVAAVRIRAGSVTGTILDTVGLLAAGSFWSYYDDGVWCDGDIFVEIVSGTVEGCIRWG